MRLLGRRFAVFFMLFHVPDLSGNFLFKPSAFLSVIINNIIDIDKLILKSPNWG